MTLVSPEELAELLASGTSVRVLDVRWSLAEPDGHAAFVSGHIPGAVYVDLETDLSDHTVPGRGRHPLPSGDALEASLRRWGVDDGDTVVVYDDWNRAGSSRAWWVLRAAGLGDVRIPDGGLGAWRALGKPVGTEVESPRPGSITLVHRNFDAGALATLTAADAAELARDGVLLDARAPERFRGEIEPIDPVAGHIPGAVNLPSTALLGPDGRFAPADDLRALFAARGVDGGNEAGAYCGSGVTAAVVVAAAEVAGIDLALFPGSWSQWSSDPANPVETGPATD